MNTRISEVDRRAHPDSPGVTRLHYKSPHGVEVLDERHINARSVGAGQRTSLSIASVIKTLLSY